MDAAIITLLATLTAIVFGSFTVQYRLIDAKHDKLRDLIDGKHDQLRDDHNQLLDAIKGIKDDIANLRTDHAERITRTEKDIEYMKDEADKPLANR